MMHPFCQSPYTKQSASNSSEESNEELTADNMAVIIVNVNIAWRAWGWYVQLTDHFGSVVSQNEASRCGVFN